MSLGVEQGVAKSLSAAPHTYRLDDLLLPEPESLVLHLEALQPQGLLPGLEGGGGGANGGADGWQLMASLWGWSLLLLLLLSGLRGGGRLLGRLAPI